LHEQAVVLTAADLYLCMAGIAVALILLIFWLPTRSFRRARRPERLTETEGFYDDSIKAKVAMGVAVVIAVGVLVYLLAPGHSASAHNKAPMMRSSRPTTPWWCRGGRVHQGGAGRRQPAGQGRPVAGADR
jgi:hypothetical protein